MKIRNFIALLSFSALTVIFSSCGDSYAPITLTSSDGKTIYKNNDTISLIKFTEGEEFTIKGGDGLYFVQSTNKDNSENKIIRHQQEENKLSIIPENEGICYLNIKDSEKNESRIVVEVEKMDRFYTVESHNIIIDGNRNFTYGERDELTQKIYDSSFVKVGGKFEFQYTNSNNGIAKIKTSESADYISGTFTQDIIYSQETGKKILSIKVSFPDKRELVFSLSEEDLTISQDLTNEYKGIYPNLEKAILEYRLSQPQDQNNDK